MKDEHIPDLNTIQTLVNKNIKIIGGRTHSKASEEYIDVEFNYPIQKYRWTGAVPIEYRRTGVSAKTENEIADLLNETYELLNPKKHESWLKEQNLFWNESNKKVTKPIFESLIDFKWKCVDCQIPKNRNWARRFQDIKELGYTASTNTHMFCQNCDKNTTHLLLLPIPRGNPSGYETWSPKLRNKILKILKYYDAYEHRHNKSLLPDHKFPEIRWDDKTKSKNSDDMAGEEIIQKFQLISNQRNQQKREVCRLCFQTNKRGYPFGIKYFYEGDENWSKQILKKGKSAELGCHGCGWYDLLKWRLSLNQLLESKKR